MADKIRVLQVPGSLRVGGLETVALNLYRFCDKNKYSFDFLVYGDAIEPLEATVEELGGRVFHIPYPHKGVRNYVKELKRIMRQYGPYDVVHAHSLFNSGLVMKAAKDLKIPVRISHAHSDRRNTRVSFIRNLYNSFMRFLVNHYTTQKVACSAGAGKYLYGKQYDENVYIVRNGVDISQYKFDPEKRQAIKQEFGWEDKKIVGHIGRLAEVKNQKKILDAFSEAYKKDNSLRLMIVGDGELKESLQAQIDALCLTDVAVLTGTRTDTAALFSAFDVYVMPSFYEGVSISLVEAQVSGVHCLVSSNAAAKETRITECINVLEYTDSDETWAEQIISLSKKERITDTEKKVKEHGYDIEEIVKNATQLYGGKND